MACARRRAYHRPMNKGCSTMIAMKIQKRDEKSNDMANVLPVCAENFVRLICCHRLTSATMATLLCFLLRLDLSHSGAAPSISTLYHLVAHFIRCSEATPHNNLAGLSLPPVSSHRTDMSSESDND